MKPIQRSRSESTSANSLKPSHHTEARPKEVTHLDNTSSESRALSQILRELQWTRQKIAVMYVERSQLLARIELLENNGQQGTGDASDNSSVEQDYSMENVAFTNEGGPPVDHE